MAQDIPSFFSTRDVPRLDVVRKKKPMFSKKDKLVTSLGVAVALLLWLVCPDVLDLWLILLSLGSFRVAYRAYKGTDSEDLGPTELYSEEDLTAQLLIEMAADTEGRMLLEEGDKIRLALKAFEDAYRRVRTSGENMLDDNTTNILRRCAAVPGMKRSLSHIRRGLRHKTLKHPENVPTFKRLRLSLLILARSLDRRQGIYLKWLKKKRARDARGNRHVR